MTIAQALSKVQIELLDAELLLAYILGTDRSYIKAHGETSLNLMDHVRFFWYTNRRSRGVPLAYITGEKEFYGLTFAVNKHTLIPRPETEQMVELALSEIKRQTSNVKHVVVIDVGTGSGCIPISLATSIKKSSNVSIFASDISKKALHVATHNAEAHHVEITFKHGNLLEPWSHGVIEQCDLVCITANLPYITKEQFDSEPSIQHEPISALVADEGGLALYRILFEQLSSIPREQPVTLFLEIDPVQAHRLEHLVREYFSSAHVILHTDLSGSNRIVTIHIV